MELISAQHFIHYVIMIVTFVGLTVAYSNVISFADARGERIRSNHVISSHVMDVIIHNNNCRFLGKDYIRIMCKHILSSSYHCSNVPAPKWMGMCVLFHSYYISYKI